jgi:hypothetical protein
VTDPIKQKLKASRGHPLGPSIQLSGPAEFLQRIGVKPGQSVVVETVIYAAEADEPHAMPVAEAVQTFGRSDGKLHVRDPYAGIPGGGQEHVLEIPAGAQYVQIAHSIR